MYMCVYIIYVSQLFGLFFSATFFMVKGTFQSCDFRRLVGVHQTLWCELYWDWKQGINREAEHILFKNQYFLSGELTWKENT